MEAVPDIKDEPYDVQRIYAFRKWIREQGKPHEGDEDNDRAEASESNETILLWLAVFTRDARISAHEITESARKNDPNASTLLSLEYHVGVVETCDDATMALVMQLMVNHEQSGVPQPGIPLGVGVGDADAALSFACAAAAHLSRCCVLAQVPLSYLGLLDLLSATDERTAVNEAREVVACFAPIRRRLTDHPSGVTGTTLQGRPAQWGCLRRVAEYLDRRAEWSLLSRHLYALLMVAAVVGWGAQRSSGFTMNAVRRAAWNRITSSGNQSGHGLVRSAMLALKINPDLFAAGSRGANGRVRTGQILKDKLASDLDRESVRSKIRKAIKANGGLVNSETAKSMKITVGVLRELVASDPVLAKEFTAGIAPTLQPRDRMRPAKK